ncbi:MAG: DUF3035 domain-containing protein [Pseudomonadota bacterium]
MRWILLAVTLLALAACSSPESRGPDEFAVVPAQPLELPESFSNLPAPTPGADNRADIIPDADVIAALGGRQQGRGIPASDNAIVTFASRFGVNPNIRGELFSADERFRGRNGRIRLLGFTPRGERYFRLYARQTLDPYSELARFRAAGVNVPTAPPR